MNELDKLVDTQGDHFRAVYAQRHRVLQDCGSHMKASLQRIRCSGWKRHEVIWNACLFLNTVCFDHSHLNFQLATQRDDWQRRLTARSLSVLLYEICEDLLRVFGKDFRESMTVLSLPETLFDQLGRETKAVSEFWSNHGSSLKVIRTIAGAHRDHDAMLLNDTIEGMDLFDLFTISNNLMELMNRLGQVSQAILTHASSVNPNGPPTHHSLPNRAERRKKKRS